MAATVTAVVQTTAPPRVLVTVLGLTGATSATVYRVVSGDRSAVRPAPLNQAQLTAGTAVLVDLEAPFGVSVTYVVSVTRAGATLDEATSSPVVLSSTDPWLTDPITGAGSPTVVVTWPEWSYDGRVAVVPVAGAFYPIVESDSMVAASSTLTLASSTQGQLTTLRSMLNTGKVLLLRAPCDGVEGGYLQVTSRRELRVGDPGPGWARTHALEVQAVAMPAVGIASTGDTLNDLQRVVPTTLQAIAVRWPGTLLDIATTNLAAQ